MRDTDTRFPGHLLIMPAKSTRGKLNLHWRVHSDPGNPQAGDQNSDVGGSDSVSTQPPSHYIR